MLVVSHINNKNKKFMDNHYISSFDTKYLKKILSQKEVSIDINSIKDFDIHLIQYLLILFKQKSITVKMILSNWEDYFKDCNDLKTQVIIDIIDNWVDLEYINELWLGELSNSTEFIKYFSDNLESKDKNFKIFEYSDIITQFKKYIETKKIDYAYVLFASEESLELFHDYLADFNKISDSDDVIYNYDFISKNDYKYLSDRINILKNKKTIKNFKIFIIEKFIIRNSEEVSNIMNILKDNDIINYEIITKEENENINVFKTIM